MEEENILGLLAEHGQKQFAAPTEISAGVPPTEEDILKQEAAKAKQAKDTLDNIAQTQSRITFLASAFLALFTGAVSGVQGAREVYNEGLNRRSFLQGLGALAGLGVPAIRTGEFLINATQKPEEPEPLPLVETDFEHYPEVLAKAATIMEGLMDSVKTSRNYQLLKKELDRIPNHVTAQRVARLKPLVHEMFGHDWDDYLKPKKNGYLPALPGTFFGSETPDQEAFMEKAIASGELVRLQENDSSQPYFCQQIGYGTGIKNDPNVMYVHREFIPVLGTLVALVNQQIDIFNQDPSAFGITMEGFPTIPHISGIKLSGAFRRLKFRVAASTESFSDHWTGTALDMISRGSSPGAGLVRFEDELKYQGKVLVPEGGILLVKNEAESVQSRTADILAKMVVRGLFVLEDVLNAEEGDYPELMPRYEPGVSNNWHVALVPSRIAHPKKSQ